MTEKEADTDRRKAERSRLLTLRAKQPTRDDSTAPGVLLSDVIREYVHWFELISPFDENNLKPACYKLTIGDEFALNGTIEALPDEAGHNFFSIPPFAVAIVKTRETINMPPFLIGRWNIQVSRAYQGLLWVGGPQVDAGYVGHLFCPVYNLSDKSVVLYRGEAIAVIDFTKTTKFDEQKSKSYSKLPENILFEDYKPQNLVSGLIIQAKEKIDGFADNLKDTQNRVDNFVGLTLGVLAVLFAALAIFVTRPDSPSIWNPAVFLICLVAVYLSCSAWLRSRSTGYTFGRVTQALILIILAVGLGIQFSRFYRQEAQIEELRKEIQGLRSTLSPASSQRIPNPPIQSPKSQ